MTVITGSTANRWSSWSTTSPTTGDVLRVPQLLPGTSDRGRGTARKPSTPRNSGSRTSSSWTSRFPSWTAGRRPAGSRPTIAPGASRWSRSPATPWGALQGREGGRLRFVPRQALLARSAGGGDAGCSRRQGRGQGEGGKVTDAGDREVQEGRRQAAAEEGSQTAAPARSKPPPRLGNARTGAACDSSRTPAASTSTASSRRAIHCASGRWASAPIRRGPHRELQGHRRGGERHADRGQDPTRENVLAHERVNETVMRKHTGDPDELRHRVQDARRHRRAAPLRIRRVPRRARQDAGQARVRSQGALGSRP